MKALEFEWQTVEEGEPWVVVRLRLPASLGKGVKPDEVLVGGRVISIGDKSLPARAIVGFPMARCRGFKIVEVDRESGNR